MWYAQLQLLFSYKDPSGAVTEAAFVSWYTHTRNRPAHAKELRLHWLKKEEEKVPGLGLFPRANVISLQQILGPCCILPVPAPIHKHMHWYNHWLDSRANTADEPAKT